MRAFIIYLVIALLGFYVFPMFCSHETVATYFPTAINPIIIFICSYLYGEVRPYGWWFPVVITAAFVPTLFIYYHPSDWFYAVGYGGLSFIASAIGWYIGKKKEEEEKAEWERRKRQNRKRE